MRAGLGWIALAAATLVGCGGSGMDGGGGCTPAQTAGVTIAASGFTPRAVCVLPGGSVTLHNADAVPHDVESGATCPQLNVGSIAAGASPSVTFPTAMTCTFFDAAHSADPAFQGTVAVTSAPVTGPGY